MQIPSSIKKCCLPILVLSILLFGCQGPKGQLPLPTITAQTQDNTQTVKATHTIVFTPTIEPSPPTSTPLPSKTAAILVPTPTWTRSPTLDPTKTSDQIEKLIEDNNNCDFPCWWGLMPGKTTVAEADPFLTPLSGAGPFYNGDPTDSATIYYRFALPQKLSVLEMLDARLHFDKGLLKYIRVSDVEIPNYRLSALLTKYGPPGEVWLSTYLSSVEPNPPFSLYLFYPEKGILAYLPALHPEKGDVIVLKGKILACLPNSAILYLWSPDEKLTFQQVGKEFTVEDISQDESEKPRLPLQKATGMDIQAFFQKYKDPSFMPCIETPVELWPTL